MKRLLIAIILSLTIISFSSGAIAAVPNLLSYQGYLTDIDGLSIGDTTISIKFQLFDDQVAGLELWSSGIIIVDAHDGVVSLLLGDSSMASLSPSLFSNSSIYLAVSPGGVDEISPRAQLVSTAYSFQAANADRADYADAVEWDSILSKPETITDIPATINQVLVYDGLSWTAGEASAHEHDPSDITIQGTGSGLDADLLDGMDSNEFSALSHQHEPADITTQGAGSGLDADLLDGHQSTYFASILHGHALDNLSDISPTVPVDGQFLGYNSSIGKWEPATPLGSNPGWIREPGGVRLIDSLDYVGIGRTNPIAVGEMFGVASRFGGNALGGMYISTPSASGRPLYGYAPGNTPTTYHYVDGTDRSWRLFHLGFDRFYLDSSGNVGIGTPSPAARLGVTSNNGTAGKFISNNLDATNAVLSAVYNGGTTQENIYAVYGFAQPSQGYGYGGYFQGGSRGVYGISNPGSNNGYGVTGTCPSGSAKNYGVHGSSFGNNGTNYGVYGSATGNSNKNYGLFGYASVGVPSLDDIAAGVYGFAPQTAYSYAGFFNGHVNIEGDVTITGSLSKGAGSFKIDHPLDPENKYLVHSFVESPDMMNVYNGNIMLDKDGEGKIELPEYFSALNKDFRYQLTCVGGYAPIYIASKIENNSFEVAGGTEGLEVSWQVTGVRKDRYAEQHRIEAEPLKQAEEQGLYLHPDLFGFDSTRAIR